MLESGDSSWVGMYQGGDEHLQCSCGEFDSPPIHQKFGSARKWDFTLAVNQSSFGLRGSIPHTPIAEIVVAW